CRHPAPVEPGGLRDRHTLGGGGLAPRRRVVPGMDAGATGPQSRSGREPGPREAQHGHVLSLISGHGARRAHRSFKVARPAIARIEAMIQNRMTMVGSCQPFFSKWWCSGAMRKTRLPVSL